MKSGSFQVIGSNGSNVELKSFSSLKEKTPDDAAATKIMAAPDRTIARHGVHQILVDWVAVVYGKELLPSSDRVTAAVTSSSAIIFIDVC